MPTIGITEHDFTLFYIKAAATSALNFPISFSLNKNYLFKLVTSIVSISITYIVLKPDNARSFKISHPNFHLLLLINLLSLKNKYKKEE